MDDRYVTVKEESDQEAPKIDSQSTQVVQDTVVPDYTYGRNQEPLDAVIAVRGASSGALKIFAKSTSVSSTGNETITGCPFTPTYAKITAVNGFTGCISVCVGCGTPTVQALVGAYDGGQDLSNSYIVRVRDTSGTIVSEGTLNSFTSDGCVLNFSTQSVTTRLLVELYG